jgi:hypothetical protein
LVLASSMLEYTRHELGRGGRCGKASFFLRKPLDWVCFVASNVGFNGEDDISRSFLNEFCHRVEAVLVVVRASFCPWLYFPTTVERHDFEVAF